MVRLDGIIEEALNRRAAQTKKGKETSLAA
jgi:hypothetical protein